MGTNVKQIAAQAGCSPATVSRVLTGSAPVRPEVRERVLAALRATGYRGRGGRTAARNGNGHGNGDAVAAGLIEVVLHQHRPVERLSVRGGALAVEPPITPPPGGLLSEPFRLSEAFHRHIVDGIVHELGACGWKAVLRTNRNLLERNLLDDINRGDCRGVLLVGEYSPDLGRFIAACGQPLVLVDILHDGWPDVIGIDNLTGVCEAVGHLVALGHRKLGFVGELANPAFRERWLGFCAATADAGVALRPEWRVDASNRIDSAAAATTALLRRDDRPSAIVCGNDYDAIGVLQAAAACGLVVPRDLSVIGFDDVDAAALVTPALTTVRVPGGEIGRRAAQHLLAQLGQPRDIVRRGAVLRVRTELVVRGSTGPAAA